MSRRGTATHTRVMVYTAVAVGVLAVSATCSNGKEPPLAVHNALADSADQVLYQTKSILTDGGVMKAEVHADTAYVFDDNTRIEMRTVHTIFFTASGARNAVLTSREGTYNTRTNNMEARGNVVVVSEDGRHLATPVLRYAQTRNEISSDSAFTMTEPPTRQMTGIGFVSDPDMNNVRCLKACSGLAGMVMLPGSGDTTRVAPPAHTPPPSAGPPSGSGAPGTPRPRGVGGTPTPPSAGATVVPSGGAPSAASPTPAPAGVPNGTTAAPAGANPAPATSQPAPSAPSKTSPPPVHPTP